MKKIFSEKFQRIIRNKEKLEKNLKIKITNRGKEIFIEDNPKEEYYAEKIIDALNFGFSFTITAATMRLLPMTNAMKIDRKAIWSPVARRSPAGHDRSISSSIPGTVRGALTSETETDGVSHWRHRRSRRG